MFRVLFILAVLFAATFANTQWIQTIYTTTLTGPQVLPNSGNPNGFGTSACYYDRNSLPKYFVCGVCHNLNDPTYAAIYVANPYNVAATPIFVFTVPLASCFEQLFQFNETVAESTESSFLNGLFYVQMFSSVYPAGEIRGQLLHQDKVYAVLSPTDTIPTPSGTNGRGIIVGTYSYFNPRRLMSLDVQHNVENAISIEIRLGQPGYTGPLVTKLVSAAQSLTDNFQLTVGEEVEYLEDNMYIQVLSVENPLGDIRGQMYPIDAEPYAAFTTRLNGNNENPITQSSYVGCGIFTYDCKERLFEYLIFHNVPNPTSVIIESAANGTAGTALFGLSRTASPIFGFKFLTLDEEFLLYSLELYVNIITTQNPSGEIRGNINVNYQYYAYMSGTQINPPKTTAFLGCATFFFLDNRTMNYDIQHNVQSPLSTDFMIGNVGENGIFQFAFPNTVSPVQGTVDLDDDELTSLVDGLAYIVVKNTEGFDNGIIRGQILRVNPCTVTRDNGISAPAPPAPFVTNPNFHINSASTVSISILVIFFALLALFC